jgi:uncharacterized protein YggT (Ycf19 family)
MLGNYMNEQLIRFLIFFISILTALYRYAIFAYILLSWFPQGWAKFRGILAQIVEPALRPFNFAKIGGLSFSAIIAFLVIDYLGSFLVSKLSAFL